MIYIESKRKALHTLEKQYSLAIIIDVTSKADAPYVKLSPFYPHGGIPIPFTQGKTSQSVEGIWQGLKVFEKEGVDVSKFSITNMTGLKRTVRKLGIPLGHSNGVDGTEYLDYITARKQIYLPSYTWVLQNRVQDVLLKLKEIAETTDLVLLDYETNEEIDNSKKPLSHAAIIKQYLYEKFPVCKNAFQ